MQTRPLGRTGHASTIVTFGAAAFARITQAEAEAAFEFVLEHGVNHIDVAPSYGEAELRLGPLMKRYRDRFFLGCKTQKRTRDEAKAELYRSLERLQVDRFDLYQFHGVDKLEDLDTILGPEGALEAVLEAREQGLLRFIGITGHRPDTHVVALQRFAFDTVLLPVNAGLAAHRQVENDYAPLLALATKRDVGVLAIKSITRQPWEDDARPYSTWYRPFDDQASIDRALWFTLSQSGVTTAPSASDVQLLPKVLGAAERYRALSAAEQADFVGAMTSLRPLFPRQGR